MIKLNLIYKLIKRKFFCVKSFCKKCGRDVHDFVAPNEVWEQVEPHIKHGGVLCYDCFCNKCEKLGLPTVWKLEKH